MYAILRSKKIDAHKQVKAFVTMKYGVSKEEAVELIRTKPSKSDRLQYDFIIVETKQIMGWKAA